MSEKDVNDGAERNEQRGQTYRMARKERRQEREESGGANQVRGAEGDAPHTPSGRSPDPLRLLSCPILLMVLPYFVWDVCVVTH